MVQCGILFPENEVRLHGLKHLLVPQSFSKPVKINIFKKLYIYKNKSNTNAHWHLKRRQMGHYLRAYLSPNSVSSLVFLKSRETLLKFTRHCKKKVLFTCII